MFLSRFSYPKDLTADIAYQMSLYSVQSRPERPLDITENDISYLWHLCYTCQPSNSQVQGPIGRY